MNAWGQLFFPEYFFEFSSPAGRDHSAIHEYPDTGNFSVDLVRRKKNILGKKNRRMDRRHHQ